jgi:ketosteroid isomerase-like protein
MRRAFVAAVLAVTFAAPVRAQAPSSAAGTDPRQAQAALLAADAAASDTTARAGLADGFTAMLAGDAVYLHPGAVVMRGREAIRAFLAAQAPTATTSLRWTPLRAAVSADGHAGYTWGVSVVTVQGADGAPVTRFGRYISFWRRAADGAWKVAAHVQIRPGSRVPLQAPAGWSAGALPDTGKGGARSRMEQADRDFAAMGGQRGPGPAFAAFADSGAVTFGQQLNFGPAEIGAGFDAGDGSHWAWGPVASGAAESGDLGFTVGQADISAPDEHGQTQTFHTKYLTVWHRQPDGTYRYLVDGGNARPAPNP